jgi:hypothetical protein
VTTFHRIVIPLDAVFLSMISGTNAAHVGPETGTYFTGSCFETHALSVQVAAQDSPQ